MAAAAAMLACLAGGLGAQTYQFDGVSISPYPQPTKADQTGHGCLEYRFEIANPTAQAHAVQIVVPADVPMGAQVRGEAAVGPGATTELFLYQPAIYTYGTGAAVYVDGRRQRDDLPISTQRMLDERRSVLCGRGIPEELRQQMEDPAAAAVAASGGSFSIAPSSPAMPIRRSRSFSSHSPASGPESLVCVSELPVARWSPHWMGYGAYDFVVLSRRELDEMPPAVWAAIREWTQCGGRLIVLDDPRQSSPWTPPPQWEQASGSSAGRPGGTYVAALGRCFVATADAFDWAAYSRRAGAGDTWRGYTQEELDRHFEMVFRSRRSVQVMLMLLVPLAVLIGPVNLLVLARRDQRIWMLVTVPVLSLVSCAALLGYSLISEGTRAWGKTIELTMLDERTHTASSVGWLSIYSPLNQRAGLMFDRQSEVTLQGLERGSFRSSLGVRCVTDWTGPQHLASGWIKARVPAYYQLRKSAVRRERVSIVRGPDGNLAAVNGLGAPIRSLTVCGPDGTTYTCGPLAPGQQGNLTVRKLSVSGFVDLPFAMGNVSAEMQEEMLTMEDAEEQTPDEDLAAQEAPKPKEPVQVSRSDASALFTEDWRFAPTQVEQAPGRYLRPGTYVAILDAPVFLELPLEKLDLRNSQTVVLGAFAEWPDEN